MTGPRAEDPEAAGPIAVALGVVDMARQGQFGAIVADWVTATR